MLLRGRRVGRAPAGGLMRASARRRRGLLGQALWNLRHGRAQQLLAAATAASAAPLGLEVYINHYGGSFANKWMWVPVFVCPPLTAAGVAGVRSQRVASTWLPLLSGVLTATGVLGTYLHGRGVARKPGGFEEASYNLVTGPPLLAPGSLSMVGGIGLLAAIVPREKW